MRDIKEDEWAKEIHETATQSGFWDEDRNYGEMLMLIVSELAESLEEHRDGRPNKYLIYTGKPEGIVIELADAGIRILDTLYANWKISYPTSIHDRFELERGSQTAINASRLYKITDNYAENLLTATVLVTRAIGRADWLAAAFVYLERLAFSLGENIWDMMRTKMEFNKTRPYKHGKAY